MKVWLDDKRPAPNGWRRCKTPDDAIFLLDTKKVTEISLDHDLALKGKKGYSDGATGYDVLTWIERRVAVDWSFPVPVMHVHSDNPAARDRMFAAIASIHRLAE